MTVIALFGATGKTGHRVLTRALAAGIEVRALVCDPAKLATTSPALAVIRGDVLDSAAVDQTVAGSNAVLSLCGGGLSAPLDRSGPVDRVIRFVLKTPTGRVLADADQHLRMLKASGPEWTVVRGPRLTETPGTATYRVGWVGVDANTQISRDDLADFILTPAKDRTFVGQMPFISA